MALKAFENSKYMKVNGKDRTIRPEVKAKIDKFEDLTKEEYETMTYGEWFYIWNGFTIEDYLSGKTGGHYVIG